MTTWGLFGALVGLAFAIDYRFRSLSWRLERLESYLQQIERRLRKEDGA